MTSWMHLYEELEDEYVGEKFTKKKNFIGGWRKNYWEKW